jgi:tetratricopeptide (TPR) repeat protein
MRKMLAAVAAALSCISAPAALFPTEPLAVAAEYYFTRHDYKQAYQLWLDVSKRQSDSVFALLRVAELKLMFEGRDAARDALRKYLDMAPIQKSGNESRREVKDKLKFVESTFISDEGLSLYLQASSRIKRKDCAGAVTLLSRAVSLESGNLLVYLDRGFCERSLGAFDHYYETVKLAYDNDPYEKEVAENVTEGHLYFKQYNKALEVLAKAPDIASSVKGRTQLALSLTEIGKTGEALPLLQSVMDQQKQAGFHPIVLYMMGRILASRLDASVEATNYLERFLAAAPREIQSLSNEGWDLYHIQERVDDAKKILAQLKTT